MREGFRFAYLQRHASRAGALDPRMAAARARYLIQLYAATPEGRHPRRQEVILKVLEDLTRLSSSS